jgi:hypothetical protein
LRDGWGEWARADSELTQLLKPYSLVRTIEGIDILRRMEDRRSGASLACVRPSCE